MGKNTFISIYLLFSFINAGFAQQGNPLRTKLKNTYESYIGVRERTGKNDGPVVELFLGYVWLKPGQPWCAAFVSYAFGQVGVKRARSGGCVSLMEQGRTIFIQNRTAQVPRAGDVFFIWFPEKKRVAHTGFIDRWEEDTVITVEGNTNEAGSREGDGVYRKRRLKRQIYAVSTYID